MKIKEFIQKWAGAKAMGPTLVIPATEEALPTIQITTDGTSTTDSCYSWSCNDKCLFYKGIPVCYKVHGLFISNAEYTTVLRPYFKALGIRSYIFKNGNIMSYEEIIQKALARFYDCAVNARLLDDILLQFINSLDCKYENKYLNYCKSLNIDQFRDVTKKHKSRLKDTTPKRTLVGAWYR